MKAVYLLSGLGADRSVFDFLDFSGFSVNHIGWIDPASGESLESYGRRLAEQIKTERPILIGVSFGGMLAVEIAKTMKTECVILISSAKTRSDIPFYLRIAGRFRLNRLVPARLLKTVNPLTFWFFGANTREEKDLLRKIIRETDDKFVKWALDQIVNWRNAIIPENLIHIHGAADKILPLKTAQYEISGGEHLMIVSKGQELSEIIKRIIGKPMQPNNRTKLN